MAKLALATTFLAAIPLLLPVGDEVLHLQIHADLNYAPTDNLGKDDKSAAKVLCAGIRDVTDAAGQSVLEKEAEQTPEAIRDDLLAGAHGDVIAARLVIFAMTEVAVAIAKNSKPSPAS